MSHFIGLLCSKCQVKFIILAPDEIYDYTFPSGLVSVTTELKKKSLIYEYLFWKDIFSSMLYLRIRNRRFSQFKFCTEFINKFTFCTESKNKKMGRL